MIVQKQKKTNRDRKQHFVNLLAHAVLEKANQMEKMENFSVTVPKAISNTISKTNIQNPPQNVVSLVPKVLENWNHLQN